MRDRAGTVHSYGHRQESVFLVGVLCDNSGRLLPPYTHNVSCPIEKTEREHTADESTMTWIHHHLVVGTRHVSKRASQDQIGRYGSVRYSTAPVSSCLSFSFEGPNFIYLDGGLSEQTSGSPVLEV